MKGEEVAWRYWKLDENGPSTSVQRYSGTPEIKGIPSPSANSRVMGLRIVARTDDGPGSEMPRDVDDGGGKYRFIGTLHVAARNQDYPRSSSSAYTGTSEGMNWVRPLYNLSIILP